MSSERDREDLLVNFIPINRDLFSHYLWEEKREYSRFEAWLYLLKEARFKKTRVVDGKYIVDVERGQVYVSLSFLADAFGWTIKRVRTLLALFEKDEMISIEHHSGTRQSIITISNYDRYNIGKRMSERETEYTPDDVDKPKALTIEIDGEQKCIDEKLSAVYKEILADETNLFYIYRNSPIKDLDALKKKHLPEFLAILTMRGDTDKGMKDVISHFANWLLEQDYKQNKEKGGSYAANTSTRYNKQPKDKPRAMAGIK